MKSFTLATVSILLAAALAAPAEKATRTADEDASSIEATAAKFTQTPFPFYIAASDGNFVNYAAGNDELQFNTPANIAFTLNGTTLYNGDTAVSYIPNANNPSNVYLSNTYTPMKCKIGGTYPSFTLTCNKASGETVFADEHTWLVGTASDIGNVNGAKVVTVQIVPV